MSLELKIFLSFLAVCFLAIVRFIHVERRRRVILREAWEEAKGPAAQDEDTKTWPPGGAN